MQTIGDFEVVRELGRGGMGVVYEAIEHPLGRRVALKLLHNKWAARQDISARFADEARKIAKLSHASIVKIYRFSHVDDTYFLALEYVEGAPFDEVLAQERFSIERAVSVLLALADALGHAHELGIIHRDIKPGNVFLRKDGSVVLGDFGIAKDLGPEALGLTNTGDVIGTPAYMSPEQAQGHPVTPATDVYSLGILAFELVTGRIPFTADTAMSLLMKHIHQPPPPLIDLAPAAPSGLVALIEQMLEKDPARRPQNGYEVKQSLVSLQKSLESLEQETVEQSSVKRTHQPGSTFDELEVTLACFELAGFSRETCQNLLPARVAFLLESWYRLARQAVYDNGGIVDRYVADKVTALYGYPQRHADHAVRAFGTAESLNKSLTAFNKAHDLQLRMRAGIVTGPALVGHIAGDMAQTSIQGVLPGDMVALSKTKLVEAPIRLNRSAYRRVHSLAEFTRFEEPRAGESWATYGQESQISTVI